MAKKIVGESQKKDEKTQKIGKNVFKNRRKKGKNEKKQGKK